MPLPIENRADNLAPSAQEVKEMSLTVALIKVVDDLFTYKTVAEKLQNTEGDQPKETLVNHHKLLLVEHLEEVAWRGIDEFLAQLDSLLTQTELPLPSPPVQRDDLDQRVESAASPRD
jgi:hypothetical protein